ncbi:MAG: hypothetical protein ACREH8_12350, partial [Opitutaceae bacterium]
MIAWALAFVIITGNVVRAQVADDSTGVSVAIKLFNLGWEYEPGDYLDAGIGGLNGYQSIDTAYNYDSESTQIMARLAVGKTYSLNLSSSGVLDLTLQAVPPPGYIMEIERVPREQYSPGYAPGSILLRVRPPAASAPARAGVATALATERTLWQVSLGSLSNGESAGAISFIDVGAASDVASIFT